jgi:hypothetical protein
LGFLVLFRRFRAAIFSSRSSFTSWTRLPSKVTGGLD